MSADQKVRANALLKIVEAQRAALVAVVSDLSCPTPQVDSALAVARNALELARPEPHRSSA